MSATLASIESSLIRWSSNLSSWPRRYSPWNSSVLFTENYDKSIYNSSFSHGFSSKDFSCHIDLVFCDIIGHTGFPTRNYSLMTSAKSFGFLTPSPFVWTLYMKIWKIEGFWIHFASLRTSYVYRPWYNFYQYPILYIEIQFKNNWWWDF